MNPAQNLLIATVKHRLDQLTKPIFSRDVVEQLLDMALQAEKAQPLAPELGLAHNELDELREANHELAEANEALTAKLNELLASFNTVHAQTGLEIGRLTNVVAQLRAENQNLRMQAMPRGYPAFPPPPVNPLLPTGVAAGMSPAEIVGAMQQAGQATKAQNYAVADLNRGMLRCAHCGGHVAEGDYHECAAVASSDEF